MRNPVICKTLVLGLAFSTVASVAAAAGPAVSNGYPGPGADAATGATAPVYDPFEKANRGLYHFNKGLDRAIVRHLAMTYERGLPKPVRAGVRNGLNNLGEPNTLMNDVLQGRAKAGGVTAVRFVVNSTVGVLGLFDVAGRAMNLPIHYSDFGQTLGRYGVKAGPYVYIPVLGPSNFRDGFGRVVDSFTGILNIHDLGATTTDRLAVSVVDGLDTRAEYDPQLKELNRVATDPYATVRSFYTQNRNASFTDNHKGVQDLPDFDAPAAGGKTATPTSTPPSPPSQPN
jgi:phospholipid-binding lipoprotein MlaA